MPVHNLPQGPVERSQVEQSPQTRGPGNVIRRIAGHQLIEEPEPFLRERERQAVSLLDSHHGRTSRTRVRSSRGRDDRRHTGDGRMREQGRQRKLDLDLGANPGHDACCQQGVPPQIEEVVMDAYPLQSQHLFPDGGQLCFDGGGGSHIALEGNRLLWCWEGLAIDLAVGGEGESLQHHIGSRDHVLRQGCLQPVPQLLTAGDPLAHHIGH